MSEVVEHRLRVMASTTQIVLVAPRPQAVLDAEARLNELERRWSRFADTSDVTRLNQSGGAWVPVGDDTIRLVETMQHASRLSDGAFDPSFLHQLLSVGYTASIDDPDRTTIAVDVPSRDHTVHDVEIDRRASQLRVPPGLSLDPGGIGKGLAADLVVTALLEAGTAGALVSIGGDIAAAGRAPNEAGWSVVVEDPNAPPEVVAAFTVSAGGVATSSTRSRRWMHEGTEVHHVIDPRTGAPSTTDLASVTVVATAGWSAEVHATAALLRGASGAVSYLVERGLDGLAVSLDGTIRSTPVFDAALNAGVST